MQVLRLNEATGQFTVIIKAERGSVLPRHRHLGSAEIYILSGSGEHPQTGRYKKDDYIFEAAGALHDAVVFDEPVRLIMLSHGPSAFLDDSDQVQFLMDAPTLAREIRQCIESLSG